MEEELKSLEAKAEKNEQDYQRISILYRQINEEKSVIKGVKKSLKEEQKTLYVKRGMVKKIITAWLITVPSAAVLAAAIFYMIKGVMS